MASNSVFNKLKKKELTDDERNEMREKFADVSIKCRHIFCVLKYYICNQKLN